MNKTQFVSKLNAKDDVLSPFLVKYIATAEGKDGKSYLNVILADSTGEIEARIWGLIVFQYWWKKYML